MATMSCQIVSAEGCIFSGQIKMLSAKGKCGELGILPGHVPFMTSLEKNTIVRLKTENDHTEEIVVFGGVLEIHPKVGVTILADSASNITLISSEEREEISMRLRDVMANQKKGDLDAAAALAALSATFGVLDEIRKLKNRAG